MPRATWSPATGAALAQSFATANGTANGTPATVVYNDSVGGAKAWQFAVSPSTRVADLGLDNALCQHALVTGFDPVTGFNLSESSVPTRAQSDAVRAGINEVLHTAKLRGKPTIIVAGRSDALVPVNHNARAYTVLNRGLDGSNTRLRYIEVVNAQHFDAFLPFSGFDTRFVPLHPYFNQAMDAVGPTCAAAPRCPPARWCAPRRAAASRARRPPSRRRRCRPVARPSTANTIEAYRPYGWLSDSEWRKLTETSVRRLPDGRVTPHYDPAMIEQFTAHDDDYGIWPHYDALQIPVLSAAGVDSTWCCPRWPGK
ncbi:Aminopeptidase Q [Manis javanica]|nr:Aminopeptidase Q [Manis javanica]